MAELLSSESPETQQRLLGQGSTSAPAIASKPIGELLIERGLLTPEQLREALDEQQQSRDPLGQILLARGWVRALDFYRLLAEKFGLPFVNLLESPPERGLFEADRVEEYSQLQYLPWSADGERMTIAVAEPSEPLFDALRERHGEQTQFVITSRFDILWTIQRMADEQIRQRATFALWSQTPELSARKIMTWAQWIALCVVVAIWGLLTWKWPTKTLLVTNAGLTVFLALSFLLRSALVWRAWRGTRLQTSRTPLDLALSDAELPIYTILVPLYKDAAVVSVLARALRRLDYPRSKLDIKLVLEDDDLETIQACKRAGLEANVELIRVPPGLPRTKPKALNYALSFARGELLTIYDAEDIPEPGQLKRAVQLFAQAPPSWVCVQARLNYFNWDENWLTRLFTLEYSLWFDWYLPGMESLNIPIPLGGTSNHFHTGVLRRLGGWDPFNVTEDTDLGLRFTQYGWRVATLDSTTFEEANSRVGNWIRQRSRWIKGYMQTYLVHMRHPVRLARRIGIRAFLGFQFFIGGAFVAPLSFLPLAALFCAWQITEAPWIAALFPDWLWLIALSNFLAAGIGLCLFHMWAAWKRGKRALAWWALLLPVYYFLMSLAAYKGAWQLVRRPHYWEKTEHGLTQQDAVGLLAL